MLKRGYLIGLGICFAIAACQGDTDSTTAPPAVETLPETSSLPPDQVEGSGQPLNPAQDAPTEPASGEALQRNAGSSLTGSVSDLSGLVTELGGRVTETEIIVDLPADVLFDFDKADILPAAVPTLEKLARLIDSAESEVVQINGHTDSKGADDYNLALSRRRAESVKTWLVESGAESDRLQTVGYGENQPVAKNELPNGTDNPEGRAKNRRVEVIIRK